MQALDQYTFFDNPQSRIDIRNFLIGQDVSPVLYDKFTRTPIYWHMGVRCACPHHHTAVAALSHHPCHVLHSVLPISIAEQHKIASRSKNTRPQCRTVSSLPTLCCSESICRS